MEKGILGKRVKKLRLSNGFSQEYLADESKLNLRTIQRIESGTTIPRGDTLVRLSTALKISPDELLEWAMQEDKGELLLINLSGLSIILNPFLGVIIPLALWVSKRDKVLHADETGKKLINFQITWLLALSLFIILIIIYCISFLKMDARLTVNSPATAIAIILFIAFYFIYSFIAIIKNTIRIQKDKPVKYKPSFKIIK